MGTLPTNVQPLFNKGSCVFSKTAELFIFIPLDQANEYNGKVMKGSRGLAHLQQDPNLLHNGATVPPKVVWIINEFELDCTIHGRKTCDTEGATTNTNFAKKVQLTMSAICKHEKPFLLETKDLMTFDSHNCSHLPEIVNIQNMHSPGRKQYTEYVSNVLRIGTSSIKLVKLKVKPK